MNVDRLLSIVVNQILRRLVHRGVDAGIDRAFKGQQPQARRAKQAMRVARRGSRF